MTLTKYTVVLRVPITVTPIDAETFLTHVAAFDARKAIEAAVSAAMAAYDIQGGDPGDKYIDWIVDFMCEGHVHDCRSKLIRRIP